MINVSSSRGYLPLATQGKSRIWRAYELPLKDVRVLILGQDPYPDPRRATGLSFSTGPDGDIPPSLAHIFQEIHDAEDRLPVSGDLEPWTQQGVMLLNRALTLPTDPQERPRRHVRWWSPVVVATMRAIAIEAEARPIAAMLWGVPAHRMRKYLGSSVKVLASSHPSPLSVDRTAGGERPFRGSKPFQEVNEWLAGGREAPIDWTIRD